MTKLKQTIAALALISSFGLVMPVQAAAPAAPAATKATKPSKTVSPKVLELRGQLKKLQADLADVKGQITKEKDKAKKATLTAKRKELGKKINDVQMQLHAAKAA